MYVERLASQDLQYICNEAVAEAVLSTRDRAKTQYGQPLPLEFPDGDLSLLMIDHLKCLPANQFYGLPRRLISPYVKGMCLADSAVTGAVGCDAAAPGFQLQLPD